MERETFKTIVLPLRERLLQIAFRLIENQQDAEDIVQEIFLKLWNIRDQLDKYNSIEALAVTMTKNLTIDRIKLRKYTVDEKDLIQLDSGTYSPDRELEQKDTIDCIRKIISQLPPLQQAIMQMKDVEGYEIAEIAEITGAHAEAIRVNLSRARKKVREQYIRIMANTTI